MKAVLSLAVFIWTLASAQAALAWGEPGHQVIGSIAEQILTSDHPRAEAQVRQLLGAHSLADATTWADCARDVVKTRSGFAYQTSMYTPNICKTAFGSYADHAALIDYASRNWVACDYEPPKKGECHKTYHFDDVTWQEGRYDRRFYSTSDHDIVSAINASILVLQGQPAPAPFSIKSKQEALFLLAHFVGDVHQPLHVGAVYLDADGKVVNPDTTAGIGEANSTKGGNFILIGSKNLHGEWDDIPKSLGVAASPALVSAAKSAQGPAATGPVGTWAAQWASETVGEAKKELSGLTFAGTGNGKWTTQLPTGYAKQMADEQTQQVERAGVRLAAVLAAIWP